VSEVLLTTPRLVLRRLVADDLDALVELDSDPEVMRYLTNGRPTPREWAATALARRIDEYERSGGTGQWAALLRETGAFIGWFGLRRRPDRDPGELELGYRLRRAVWGRGLATEGSRALVAAAFTRFGAHRVWAQTMFVNQASRRVMARAGLVHVRTFHEHFDDPIPGTELGEVEYALTAGQWRAQPPGEGEGDGDGEGDGASPGTQPPGGHIG
jgi:RimJ/RimL family protein N-acetyltransferase